jgi:hypothetical protein
MTKRSANILAIKTLVSLPMGYTFAQLWLGERRYEAFEVKPAQKNRFQIQVGREDEGVVFLFGFDYQMSSRLVELPITQGTGHLSSDNLALLFGGICLLEEFTDLASFRVTIG